MKELLYGWVRDIAFYTLLMTVVLHVLPEKSQKKYLHFFMGVVLIILVISPALKAAGLNSRLDDTYTRQTFDTELQQFREKQRVLEEEYQKRVEESLEELQREEQEELNEVPRKGEDIEIPEIQVTIRDTKED